MRLEVAEEQAGERLDRLLAGPLGSRSAAERAIADGRVLVGGRARPKSHLVACGDVVEVTDAPPPPAPDVNAPASFTTIYEDDEILVVDKPAGVVSHPARGHETGTLAQATGGLLVHRLDRDTSGLLVVARDEATLRTLQDDLRERRIEREYLTLVNGRPRATTGTVDAPIGRDRRVRTRHSTDTDTPREAITHFALEETLPQATLLRVRLETGRTHQIRVHLQAIGHPVCGDPEYGPPTGAYGLERQFLHATRLAFDHPRSGDRLELHSPLPRDLARALEAARLPG